MKNVIFVFGLILLLYSCKKEDKDNTTEQPAVNKSAYLPMAAGNYWIYQWVDVDTNGNEFQADYYDSVVISQDTIIRGKTYYKREFYTFYQNSKYPTDHQSDFYLDSSGYLVNIWGWILFSENNYTDTIFQRIRKVPSDTNILCWVSYKMERVSGSITVPAGTFTDLLNYRGTYKGNPPFWHNKNPEYDNKYYAKNVGVILSTLFYSGTSAYYVEKRLVRYRIFK
jgi:hypothetical protein